MHNGYENLIGIDNAYVLLCLTGGIAIRLDPTDVSERNLIISYLKYFKEKNKLIGIVGCELNKVFELNP